jgi:hypothetical protein
MLATTDRIERANQKTFRAFDVDFLKRYLSRQPNARTRSIQQPISKECSLSGPVQKSPTDRDLARTSHGSSQKLERYLTSEVEYIRTFGYMK